MTTLLFAEHNGQVLNIPTIRSISAAQQLGKAVHILVVGANSILAANHASTLNGIELVLHAENSAYDHFLAEPIADLILSLKQNYSNFVAPSTTTGKNIMPRVAALLDVMQISEVTKIIDHCTFERPIYAGNAFQTVQSNDFVKVLTVRATCFPSVKGDNTAPIKRITYNSNVKLSNFINEERISAERPELTSANIIVSGGRALGSQENFQKMIFPLANKLGAAIGASRAAVDLGYAPNDWQIGQSGKIVAPTLYIACGISGAIQHTAGIKDSKVIIAINQDENAPIFQIADYGIVGDLFEILPELSSKIDKILSANK